MISGKNYPVFFGFLLFACVAYAFCLDSLETDSTAGKIQTTDSTKHAVLVDESVIDTGNMAPATLQHSDTNISDAKKNDTAVLTNVDKKTSLPDSNLILNSPDNQIAKIESNSNEQFKTIGEYHRLTGIYQVIEGAMIILAGAVLINKEDYSTFAMSFIALGGINIGLGLWEIKISSKLIDNNRP